MKEMEEMTKLGTGYFLTTPVRKIMTSAITGTPKVWACFKNLAN